MLKNKSNRSEYVAWKFVAIFAEIFSQGKCSKEQRICEFIENCPLKIVKINVEAF